MTGSAGTAMDVLFPRRSFNFNSRGREFEGGRTLRFAGSEGWRIQNPWEIKGTDQFTKQGYRSGNLGKSRVQIIFGELQVGKTGC